MLFRLQCQQRVHTGNRGDIRLFKLRLEGLYRVNHAEQFQFGFVQPGLARRIGEVGDIALPGVINQHVGAAETRGDRVSEGLNFRFIQYVAAPGEHLSFWIFVLQRRMGAGQPIRVAATKRDLRPFAQQQAQRFKADP